MDDLGVVLIIDNYSLVINAGRHAGVKVGDLVKIMDNQGPELKDPFTGEYLGNLPLLKDEVKVEQVEDDFSICTTPYITVKSSNQSLFQPLTSFNSSKEKTSKRRLNVEINNTISKKSKKPIKIGDPIVIVR